jgi:hypothetical protein
LHELDREHSSAYLMADNLPFDDARVERFAARTVFRGGGGSSKLGGVMRTGRAVWAVSLVALVASCGGDGERGGQLVDVATEPPGDNCAAGGVVIRAGTDGDGDGVLDADEVASSRFVCSDASVGTRVRLDEEPPGLNCSGGGVAIHSGRDENRNGVLDDDEITATEYVCGPEVASNPEVIEGDVFVSNQLDAEHLIGVRVVTGTLVIDAPGLAEMDLSALEEVGGDFTVGSPQMLDCPLLARVGGDLRVGAYEIEQVAFPALMEVVGEVIIASPWLEAIDLSALERVGGRLEIRGGLLEAIELPRLGETAGMPAFGDGLFVSEVPELATFSAPVLVATPVLRIEDNLSLLSIELPGLSTVVVIDIVRNPQLPTCQATAVAAQTDAGTVNIGGNDDDGVCP